MDTLIVPTIPWEIGKDKDGVWVVKEKHLSISEQDIFLARFLHIIYAEHYPEQYTVIYYSLSSEGKLYREGTSVFTWSDSEIESLWYQVDPKFMITLLL